MGQLVDDPTDAIVPFSALAAGTAERKGTAVSNDAAAALAGYGIVDDRRPDPQSNRRKGLGRFEDRAMVRVDRPEPVMRSRRVPELADATGVGGPVASGQLVDQRVNVDGIHDGRQGALQASRAGQFRVLVARGEDKAVIR